MTTAAPRLLATLAAGALVLGACSSGGDDDAAPATGEAREVTLMLNWTPNAHHVGVYAAQAKGWYADAGIDLTVIEPATAGVEQAVATGAADIGMAQAESLLPARAAGVPVLSVATVLPTNDSSLLSLAEDDITRPRDLEGTRYAAFGGALETEIISSLMECDGADPASVEYASFGNYDYLGGMQADQFDSAWVFTGWDGVRAETVEGVEVNEVRFADWAECVPNWYTPLFLAAESTITDDPDLVSDFLEVTARGYQVAIDDPATGATLLVEQVPELDATLVDAAVAYYAPLFLPASGRWGEQDEAVWTEFADFLNSAGVTDDPVDGGTAFTNDLLER